MNLQYKKLEKSRSNFYSEIGNMENSLIDKIEFDFSITDVGGDGLCVLEISKNNVAGLDHCIEIIKQKGKLTLEDFEELTI